MRKETAELMKKWAGRREVRSFLVDLAQDQKRQCTLHSYNRLMTGRLQSQFNACRKPHPKAGFFFRS